MRYGLRNALRIFSRPFSLKPGDGSHATPNDMPHYKTFAMSLWPHTPCCNSCTPCVPQPCAYLRPSPARPPFRACLVATGLVFWVSHLHRWRRLLCTLNQLQYLLTGQGWRFGISGKSTLHGHRHPVAMPMVVADRSP